MAGYYSESYVNSLVAHLGGVRDAVDNEAQEIGLRAAALLAPHKKTGQTRFDVDTDGVDAVVSMVGEGVKSIEFGHFHNFSGEYVLGLYILTAAAGLLG